MQKHLFITLPLILVCQFALTQQHLRLTEASAAQVHWQAVDTEKVKIKKQKTQQQKNEEKPNQTTFYYNKNQQIERLKPVLNTIGKLNTKDKAYESRFWFGGQRAVLLAYMRRWVNPLDAA